MSDLSEHIGSRNARLFGSTTTCSASGPSGRELAQRYLLMASDPDLTDDARAEARELATIAATLANAEATSARAEQESRLADAEWARIREGR